MRAVLYRTVTHMATLAEEMEELQNKVQKDRKYIKEMEAFKKTILKANEDCVAHIEGVHGEKSQNLRNGQEGKKVYQGT